MICLVEFWARRLSNSLFLQNSLGKESTTNMNNPITLDDWWNYIDTDCPIAKAKYFLRNYGGMGNGIYLRNVLAFLKEKTNLVCHRRYCEDRCDVSGCYSIQGEKENIIFRIDPTTPTVNGSRPYPSVVVCW